MLIFGLRSAVTSFNRDVFETGEKFFLFAFLLLDKRSPAANPSQPDAHHFEKPRMRPVSWDIRRQKARIGAETVSFGR